MSKTLFDKTVLASGVVLLCVITIAVSGCTTHQKKRGIVFRGDWAFEINRTPWVGHPGNTDIPGTEENSQKQKKSLCNKEKESSLSDALLGPLASLKGKCRCKNCVTSNGNINITSYNPTIANSFPPMGGTYPGGFPSAPLSLPPGAIVVPTGVLMPNGTILPHHFFYSQMANGQGNINQQQAWQQGQTQQNNQNTQLEQNQGDLPPKPTTGQAPPLAMPAGNANVSMTNNATTDNIPQGVLVQTPSAATAAVAPMNALPMNGASTNVATSTVTAPTIPQEMQNILAQNAMQQAYVNPSNPMLVNPAMAQVMPGMSMTGTQSPGYPPIAYAPSGYSPGYAQQMDYPPLTGPLGTAQQMSQQALASTGTSQAGASADSDMEEEAVSPKHVASMPYPRHHPVPIRPVYQRSMGMAPNYQAMMPPYYPGQNMHGGMSPQMQINQAAALQERQLMLERQRQALIMQQNAALQQSTRLTNKTAASRKKTTTEAEKYYGEDDENVAPVPPMSKILLANHQTPILQPPTERVSQTMVPKETTKKKSR